MVSHILAQEYSTRLAPVNDELPQTPSPDADILIVSTEEIGPLETSDFSAFIPSSGANDAEASPTIIQPLYSTEIVQPIPFEERGDLAPLTESIPSTAGEIDSGERFAFPVAESVLTEYVESDLYIPIPMSQMPGADASATPPPNAPSAGATPKKSPKPEPKKPAPKHPNGIEL